MEDDETLSKVQEKVLEKFLKKTGKPRHMGRISAVSLRSDPAKGLWKS